MGYRYGMYVITHWSCAELHATDLPSLTGMKGRWQRMAFLLIVVLLVLLSSRRTGGSGVAPSHANKMRRYQKLYERQARSQWCI